MSAAEDTSFARLVSLACHDLRTPLATVHGFALTLANADVAEPIARYLRIMGEATDQLAELLDVLALVARIEAGRYDPVVDNVEAGVLARAAAERLGSGRALANGDGQTVRVDREATERALANLALCAVRHGGVERVELAVAGTEISIGPVAPDAAPVIVGDDLRDLGAAVGRRVVEALGGSVSLDGDTLRVRLPQ